MSCCPKPDRTPLDPDREGPSEEDLARFGEESEYCEFEDEAGYGGASWEPGQKTVVKRIGLPIAAVCAGVGFVLAFVL